MRPLYATPPRDAAEDSSAGLQKIHGARLAPHQDREGSVSRAATFAGGKSKTIVVIPAKAGSSGFQPKTLDSRLRENDELI